MQTGKIQRLIEVLIRAFEALDVDFPLKEVEDLSVMVHKSMAIQSRNFHSLEHVFTLFDSDPIQTLAALFHDLVYYQVDRGIAPQIYTLVSPYIREEEEEIFIVDHLNPDDQLFWLTLGVFGLQTGQRLSPSAGLNEFLSALFMSKRLAGLLNPRHLLEISLCIEATIPFRNLNEAGQSSLEVLEERTRQINERYHLGMTLEEIQRAVERATVFSNNDVQNFAFEDPSGFLDNTWKLLPETNIALRSGEIYSIREYRQALQRMEGLFSTLDPGTVFHSYRGVPSSQEYERMTSLAYQNITTAREYLRAKLLTMSVLEALAEVTGGDAPISLFLGEVARFGDGMPKRMEHFLPRLEPGSGIVHTFTYKVLDSGRIGESTFDMRSSPTTLFLYKILRPESLPILLQYGRDMFLGELSPREFLSKVDGFAVAAIAIACAEMVPTRRNELRAYAQERLRTHSNRMDDDSSE